MFVAYIYNIRDVLEEYTCLFFYQHSLKLKKQETLFLFLLLIFLILFVSMLR